MCTHTSIFIVLFQTWGASLALFVIPFVSGPSSRCPGSVCDHCHWASPYSCAFQPRKPQPKPQLPMGAVRFSGPRWTWRHWEKKLKSCITWGIFGRICDDSEKSIRKFKSPQSKPTFGMIWSRGTCGFECRVACASLILGLLGLACLLCRDLSEGAPSRVLLNETVNL